MTKSNVFDTFWQFNVINVLMFSYDRQFLIFSYCLLFNYANLSVFINFWLYVVIILYVMHFKYICQPKEKMELLFILITKNC